MGRVTMALTPYKPFHLAAPESTSMDLSNSAQNQTARCVMVTPLEIRKAGFE